MKNFMLKQSRKFFSEKGINFKYICSSLQKTFEVLGYLLAPLDKIKQ